MEKNSVDELVAKIHSKINSLPVYPPPSKFPFSPSPKNAALRPENEIEAVDCEHRYAQ